MTRPHDLESGMLAALAVLLALTGLADLGVIHLTAGH